MESIPEFDDMPEIPFVSAEVAYPDSWMIASDQQPRCATPCPSPTSASSSTSFWSSIIGLRPSASKSSATSSSSGESSPVFGQTSVRSISPSRASNNSRKRAGSLSSIASSRTKPAPAKSILSSGSSVKTRKHKAPSVKFLDMPTIHYDDEYPRDGEDEEFDEYGRSASGASSPSSMSPPPKKKAKGLGGFLSFRWLFGPSSKAENRDLQTGAQSPRPGQAPGRPAISGPYPLWDSPPRRARGDAGGAKSSAASLRSVRSNGSLRSVRSCGSRLPTYFPR
ncbi:hypothetical protein OH77DRAFT_1126075 [Trametes cingulata]|nr:hypothetical protein OH77DRAFT_1126075 [Trametes cingulata]